MRPGFDSKLFYKEYKTIVFPHDNTTGPKSVEKKFIIAMNPIIPLINVLILKNFLILSLKRHNIF